MDDAKFAVVGFGSTGRVALSAVGLHALKNPCWIDPADHRKRLPSNGIGRTVEARGWHAGTGNECRQMLEDVLIATHGQVPVEFYGAGRCLRFTGRSVREIKRLVKGPLTIEGHPAHRWLSRIAKKN